MSQNSFRCPDPGLMPMAQAFIKHLLWASPWDSKEEYSSLSHYPEGHLDREGRHPCV